LQPQYRATTYVAADACNRDPERHDASAR
jgi:hypothetical protein